MSAPLFSLVMNSPLGVLGLESDGEALTKVRFDAPEDPETRPCPALDRAREQLVEYFEGRRLQFDLPLSPSGTAFQQRVWQALREIPFGTTVTYMELTRRLGEPLAIRAVAAANGRNPIPIVIPCHRIVGAKHELTGYSGGLWRKKLLLELEARQASPGPLWE